MKIGNRFTTGVSALALVGLCSVCASATAHPVYRPYKLGTAPIDPNQPLHHVGPYSPPYQAPKIRSGTWTAVANVPFSRGGFGPLQLTDGSVMMYDTTFSSTTPWYKLAPDSKGNYTDGTWTKLAALPSGYAPDFFAEQVLTDGRVIINGGEYNQGSSAWTNLGALYDPVADSWTAVAPPSGWSTIGDAESIILPNGTYMLANCCDSPGQAGLAAISGTTVTWTKQGTISCSGNPCNDEQGFTALPDGNVFMVDVWNLPANKDDYWIYNTGAGTWSLAGQTPNLLTETSTRELGAAALTPLSGTQGTIIQFSANASLGINDSYNVSTGKWTAGPVMKVGTAIYDCADAPAATLPDGNVLVQASPGTFGTPSHFWEFTLTARGKMKTNQVSDPSGASNTSSFEGNLLVLPTGQVLWDQSQAGKVVSLYTPLGSPNSSWLPVVSSVSSSLTVGSTGNAISGTNFNGFDLGGVYGDDAQAASNFPLVRITNTASGAVCFGRSYNFSTMGVWTTGTTNAVFDIPGGCATGASTLQVIVNGIASTGVSVTLS